MKMRKKHLWMTMVFILTFLCVLCTAGEKRTYAAVNSSLVHLKEGITYRYDADGNGKADLVKVIVDKDNTYINGIRITVNNKNVLTIKETMMVRVDVRLCTLSNKKVFFFVEGMGDNGYEFFARLYQMKNGKLAVASNLRSLLNMKAYTYRSNVEVKSVAGNTITFKYMNTNYTLGAFEYLVPMKYIGGKIKPASSNYRMVYSKYGYKPNKWTTARKITAYTSVSLKKKQFVLPINEVVKINRVYIKAKVPYFQITRKNGQKGWIKALPQYKGQGYCFKEAMIAG